MSIVADIVKLAMDSWPLPNFKAKAEVDAWLVKLIPDLTKIIYNAGGIEAVRAELAATPVESFHACAFAEAGGNRPFIDFIRNVDWAKVLEIVNLIIAVIPKQPADGPVA